jgi:CRISPR/Cas system CSM-associated protein Csm4 (group 5 of RAMP superfamily)
MSNYVSQDQFDCFKSELRRLMEQKDQNLLEVKVEHHAFISENVRIMKMIDSINWDSIKNAENMTSFVLAECTQVIEGYIQQLVVDIKYWR